MILSVKNAGFGVAAKDIAAIRPAPTRRASCRAVRFRYALRGIVFCPFALCDTLPAACHPVAGTFAASLARAAGGCLAAATHGATARNFGAVPPGGAAFPPGNGLAASPGRHGGTRRAAADRPPRQLVQLLYNNGTKPIQPPAILMATPKGESGSKDRWFYHVAVSAFH